MPVKTLACSLGWTAFLLETTPIITATTMTPVMLVQMEEAMVAPPVVRHADPRVAPRAGAVEIN